MKLMLRIKLIKIILLVQSREQSISFTLIEVFYGMKSYIQKDESLKPNNEDYVSYIEVENKKKARYDGLVCRNKANLQLNASEDDILQFNYPLPKITKSCTKFLKKCDLRNKILKNKILKKTVKYISLETALTNCTRLKHNEVSIVLICNFANDKEAYTTVIFVKYGKKGKDLANYTNMINENLNTSMYEWNNGKKNI
jgi:hypothetical protein